MSLSWAAGIVVGLTLLISGAAKLASGTWPAQATALGAPSWAVPLVAPLELIVGASLMAHVGYPVAPLLAALLLLAFSGLLAMNLAAGRRPPCACFGSRSTRPIGPWSLVRNGVLLVLAVVAAVV
ncbi:MAG: hypothetical protein JWL70_2087 [Acidimicrobiia bacterium]|nr:hypothetical protein [Acidimicrobiia bacterium]